MRGGQNYKKNMLHVSLGRCVLSHENWLMSHTVIQQVRRERFLKPSIHHLRPLALWSSSGNKYCSALLETSSDCILDNVHQICTKDAYNVIIYK